MSRLGRAGVWLLGSVLVSSVHAQSNERLFRSWRWPLEGSSARNAGWADVAAAAPDDATAAQVNPALLGTLTKAEVVVGAWAAGAGRAALGDELRARTALGSTGVALRISPRWTLALFAAQPRAIEYTLVPVRLSDGSTDTGRLSARLLELGVSAAVRATPRLLLGAQVHSSRLTLAGTLRQEPAVGPATLVVDTGGATTRPGLRLGLAYDASSKLTLGLASATGRAHTFTRAANSPLLGVQLDPGSPYQVRQPSLLSGALHLRLTPRFALAAQVDYVRWSEIPAGLVIVRGARARDEYRLDDAFEPRAGGEFSIPLRRTAIQVRAGVHLQSPGALRFEGDDAVESAAFPGSDWKPTGGVGVSVVTARGWRVDLAGRFGGERPVALMGLSARF